MDDIERDVRAALERLAARVPSPADSLVQRTRRRARTIRAVRAASIGAAALVLLGGVAVAVESPGRGEPTDRVSTPAPRSSSTTSTTTTTGAVTVPATSPEQDAPGATLGDSTAATTVAPATTTTQPQCGAPAIFEGSPWLQLTLLPDGNIRLVISGQPTGPANEVHVYVLDDGTRGEGYLERVYTPGEFGPHWYDNGWMLNGIEHCARSRIAFDVSPESATAIDRQGP